MKVLTENTAWRVVDRGPQSGLFIETISGTKLARIGGIVPSLLFWDKYLRRNVPIDIDTLRAVWETWR